LFFWRDSPHWARASSLTRFLDHIQQRTTVGRTPLDEWSARLRDLYLTTHNIHNRESSMSPVGFEPKISGSERPQSYALDRAANRTGIQRGLRDDIWYVDPICKVVHDICSEHMWQFLNFSSWLFWSCRFSVFIPLVVKYRCCEVLYRMIISVSVHCQNQNCDISFVIAKLNSKWRRLFYSCLQNHSFRFLTSMSLSMKLTDGTSSYIPILWAEFQYQTSQCGINIGRTGNGRDISPSTSGSPCQYQSIKFSTSVIQPYKLTASLNKHLKNLIPVFYGQERHEPFCSLNKRKRRHYCWKLSQILPKFGIER
jgi:hypothetical protein